MGTVPGRGCEPGPLAVTWVQRCRRVSGQVAAQLTGRVLSRGSDILAAKAVPGLLALAHLSPYLGWVTPGGWGGAVSAGSSGASPQQGSLAGPRGLTCAPWQGRGWTHSQAAGPVWEGSLDKVRGIQMPVPRPVATRRRPHELAPRWKGVSMRTGTTSGFQADRGARCLSGQRPMAKQRFCIWWARAKSTLPSWQDWEQCYPHLPQILWQLPPRQDQPRSRHGPDSLVLAAWIHGRCRSGASTLPVDPYDLAIGSLGGCVPARVWQGWDPAALGWPLSLNLALTPHKDAGISKPSLPEAQH